MTNSSKSVIEINGKRYDARTGKILATRDTNKNKSINSNRSTASSKAAPINLSKSKAMNDISRSTPRMVNQTKRTVSKSSTLMRQAVKKPAVNKPAIRSAASLVPVKKPTLQKPTRSTASITGLTSSQDITRQSRAVNTKQSKLISKFGKQPITKSTPHKVASLPVRPAPKAAPMRSTSISRTPSNPKIKQQPTRATKSTTESMLERGLRNSQSHQQKLTSKQKKAAKKPRFAGKIASYSAGALAALLLSGFYIYQNIPSLSMRYATTRSGISATLPGYKPSGFSMSNKIQYNPGQVTINFASNSDDRRFTITQRESSWNSESLYTSYVTTKADQIQKYEDKGRTIYLYGDNNATWVNGGIWYDINGDSQLNSDQLIRIASSL